MLFALLSSLLLISCEKCNYYYVKYEASGNLKDGQTFQVAFNKANGERETIWFTSQKEYEVVVGPVEKGFKAYIYANCPNEANVAGFYTGISVSKNNKPFNYVMSSSGETFLESFCEYTVK